MGYRSKAGLSTISLTKVENIENQMSVIKFNKELVRHFGHKMIVSRVPDHIRRCLTPQGGILMNRTLIGVLVAVAVVGVAAAVLLFAGCTWQPTREELGLSRPVASTTIATPPTEDEKERLRCAVWTWLTVPEGGAWEVRLGLIGEMASQVYFDGRPMKTTTDEVELDLVSFILAQGRNEAVRRLGAGVKPTLVAGEYEGRAVVGVDQPEWLALNFVAERKILDLPGDVAAKWLWRGIVGEYGFTSSEMARLKEVASREAFIRSAGDGLADMKDLVRARKLEDRVQSVLRDMSPLLPEFPSTTSAGLDGPRPEITASATSRTTGTRRFI